MPKPITIDFRNMWGGFFKHDNLITNTLSLEYDVSVDEQNPDIVVCQVCPKSHGAPDPQNFTHMLKGKSKVVYWLVESIDRTGNPDYSSCDFSFSSCEYDDHKNVRVLCCVTIFLAILRMLDFFLEYMFPACRQTSLHT